MAAKVCEIVEVHPNAWRSRCRCGRLHRLRNHWVDCPVPCTCGRLLTRRGDYRTWEEAHSAYILRQAMWTREARDALGRPLYFSRRGMVRGRRE